VEGPLWTRRIEGSAGCERSKRCSALSSPNTREISGARSAPISRSTLSSSWQAIWSRPQLDRRTKSLATIATLAALGRPLALELNVRMALNNGATKEEIVETLLHIAPYAGFPACWEGLKVAQRVFRVTQKPG
jgi:4-carboxymuconolactone decarboxylase